MAKNYSDPGSDDDNPYAPPEADLDPRSNVKGKVVAPAIALMVVGGLGLAFSIFNVVFAIISGPPEIDPNAPEFIRNMQTASVGPVAIVVQALFIAVNAAILLGAVQMMTFKSRTFAIASSVLAMINIGTCCCFIGLPVGIWSLIVLMSKDVVAAFESVAE